MHLHVSVHNKYTLYELYMHESFDSTLNLHTPSTPYFISISNYTCTVYVSSLQFTVLLVIFCDTKIFKQTDIACVSNDIIALIS